MSYLIEEYIALSAGIPFIEFDKHLAATQFIAEKSVASGLELIQVNVELSKADRNRRIICNTIAKRIVGEALSSSALY